MDGHLCDRSETGVVCVRVCVYVCVSSARGGSPGPRSAGARGSPTRLIGGHVAVQEAQARLNAGDDGSEADAMGVRGAWPVILVYVVRPRIFH